MRRLYFVGDGERDAAMVPALVRTIVGAEFKHSCEAWSKVRLHDEKRPSGHALRGYARKLRYLLDRARTEQADGVVATVDADRARKHERLKQMKDARDADRSQRAPLPVALGEADPHGEAWLLDDPVAVREGLNLLSNAEIPNVRKAPYPKTALEGLHQASDRARERPQTVWADIAAHVHISHCNHAAETGFRAFAEEVQQELDPLFAQTA